MDKEKKHSSISKTVDKALRILDLFSTMKKEMGIVEIARNVKVNTSTVQRIVNTLYRHNYLQQHSGNARYKLGLKLLEVSNQVLAGIDLRQTARPFLEQLRDRTGETIHLMIMDGSRGVYIDALESPQRIRVASAIGTREELHCSSIGKALLAFSTEKEVGRIIETQGLRRKTPHTITDPNEFKEQLVQIRKRGYAVDDEEGQIGTRCIGASIFDHTGKNVAAISIAAPSYRLDQQKIEQFTPIVTEIANKISKNLGNIEKKHYRK